MNAIEIRNLCKNFGEKQALNGLDMTVPQGAIYGFIGENGSGKSTTEKIICGLIHPTSGSVKLYGRDYTNQDVRASVGVLIEAPGCFPNLSVWNNLMIQATNLSLADKENAVRKVLTLVRMEGAAGNKYKNCSLGMKQRIGIAMALLGSPKLLVLDEPINGLDADGMRIMREVLTDITKTGATVLISSHILGELEKIATHYGIIRGGKMIVEMTAKELDKTCPTFVCIQTKDHNKTIQALNIKYSKVIEDKERNLVRIYDAKTPQEVAKYLYDNGIIVNELGTQKIGLEEYYINLMSNKGVR
ncbi:MAG: ATP-binding cassette domain-containing protein [Clostridia bacterium]|nr:ATP-binding cassette domain-containing protein [Clostridia bacterium]MBQ6883620.1 ATP-binding cassette domain-containing protein [Clostridia bacterium]